MMKQGWREALFLREALADAAAVEMAPPLLPLLADTGPVSAFEAVVCKIVMVLI